MHLLDMGLSANTRSTYRTAESSLAHFLKSIGINVTLPVDWRHIVLWISKLSYARKHATIRGYLSGIATLHRDNGYPTPTDNHVVRRVLDGIQRDQAQRGQKSLRSLPITTTLLDIIAPSVDMSNADEAMMFTAMRTGTSALLRIGEFTDTGEPERLLRMRHIRRMTGGYMITLPFTKTDQIGGNQSAFVGDASTVTLLDTYIKRRKPTTDSALFVFKDGTPLSRSKLLHRISQLLSSVHTPPHRGYSFRAGGATSLNEAGVAAHTIKSLGRWVSNAYELYVRQTPNQLLSQAAASSSSRSPL